MRLTRRTVEFIIYIAIIWPCSIQSKRIKKRQIYREEVLPHTGGKIPETAFDSDRLALNRLQKEGIAIPDGVILEQRNPKVFPYSNNDLRPVFKVEVMPDGRYTASEGQYLHLLPPSSETTYPIPRITNENLPAFLPFPSQPINFQPLAQQFIQQQPLAHQIVQHLPLAQQLVQHQPPAQQLIQFQSLAQQPLHSTVYQPRYKQLIIPNTKSLQNAALSHNNFIQSLPGFIYTPFTSSYTNHQIHSHLHGNSLSNIKQYQKQRQPTAASIDFYREDFIGSQALEDLSTFLNHAVYSIPIR